MEYSCENIFKLIALGIAIYVFLRIIQDNCDIGLGGFFRSVEGFVGSKAPAPVSGGISASEGGGEDSGPQPVSGLGRTPSTCYPQPALKAEDLLPKEDSDAIKEFNIAKPAGEGTLQGINMLNAGFHVGVNTIGQSLRNANRQIRAEPPNPQVQVSPWMTSSIGPDLLRRPLEDEGCPGSKAGSGSDDLSGTGTEAGSPVGA